MDKVISAHVLAFGGKGASFLDYEQRVTLWNRAAEIHPSKRAALLVLHMGPTAGQICLHSGGDSFMEGVEATAVIQTLKRYFLPDANRPSISGCREILEPRKAPSDNGAIPPGI